MIFWIMVSSWEKDLMGMENRQCLFKYYLNKINFCDPISFHCMTSTFSTIKNGNVGRHINCCVEVVILANRQCIFKSVYRGIICTNIESKQRFLSLWKSSTTFFISFVLLIPLKNKKVIYQHQTKTENCNKSTKIVQDSAFIYLPTLIKLSRPAK